MQTSQLKSALTLPVDMVSLALQKRLPAAYGALASAASIDLKVAFAPRDEWPAAQQELNRLMERDASAARGKTEGALNAGDRRALYHLVRARRPANVLEIGTHVGSSTIHFAAALRANAVEGAVGRLRTVDIIDVNGPDAPWARRGMAHSPRQMVEALGMGEQVTFQAADSNDFLLTCEDSYDFVFLDGSHAAKDVYNEVQLVQRCLRPDALILLHDFFPDGRPLWPDSRALPGPWLAYSRLRREGAPVEVIPLGDLPWPTKLGSHRTSLAIMVAG